MPFNLFSSFKKKEVEPLYPPRFAKIEINDVARSQGVDDDQNKIIRYFENGKNLWTKPYIEELVNVLRSEGVPVAEEKIDEEEEFEWDSIATLGTISYRK